MLICAICGGEEVDWLGDHLQEAHAMAVEEYLTKYPGEVVASNRLVSGVASPKDLQRAHPTKPEDLTISMMGIQFKVNVGVPASVCLPAPDHYLLPTCGDLAQDVAMALLALHRNRSLFVHGPPGTGKDAFFHAWSAETRTPGILRQFVPGTDLESWFFTRSFNEQGTFWEEGEVLRALRDGYLTEDGTRVPYIILFSDIDRAQKDQAEYMRLIIDSISGRVQGPSGRTYNVLPGTRIVATANTSGGGDTTGRMVSSNVMDGSIMNRWNWKLQFHDMSWADELRIIKAKFPSLASEDTLLKKLELITHAVRKAIGQQDLYGEFSHRDICHILMAVEDLAFVSGADAISRLRKGLRVWIDGLPDNDTRDAAVRIADPHLDLVSNKKTKAKT